jgi:hypothetical protein
VVVWAVLTLFLLGWALVTPYLLLGAALVADGFDGPSTVESRKAAGVVLTCALGSSLLLPWFGMLLAVCTERWRTAWFFTAVLVVGGAAFGRFGGPTLVELVRR